MKTIVSVIPVEDEDKRLLEQAGTRLPLLLRSRGKSRPTACATRR